MGFWITGNLKIPPNPLCLYLRLRPFNAYLIGLTSIAFVTELLDTSKSIWLVIERRYFSFNKIAALCNGKCLENKT